MNNEVSRTAQRALSLPAVDRCDIIDDIVKTLRKDGLCPDEPKLRKKLNAASVEDLSRISDMFYRFGSKEILQAI